LVDYLRNRVDRKLLDDVVSRAKSAGKPFPPGIMAGLFYQFHQRDPAVTKRIFADLEKRQRGMLTLQEKIADMRRQQAGRIHELQLQAWMIIVFNAYRQGTRLNKSSSFRWTTDQPFPQI